MVVLVIALSSLVEVQRRFTSAWRLHHQRDCPDIKATNLECARNN
jgi:hypothetical protein